MSKKSKTAKVPCWKKQHFPRLAGLTDSLMHKAQVREDSQEHALLRSGRVVRLQRQFDKIEAEMREHLIKALMPLESEALSHISICNQAVPQLPPSCANSSAAVRAEKAAQAQRQQALMEIQKSRTALAQLWAKIHYECEVAESKLDEAVAAANTEIAYYSKATKFDVIEAEIPVLVRHFSPSELLKPQLMNQIQTLMEGRYESF